MLRNDAACPALVGPSHDYIAARDPVVPSFAKGDLRVSNIAPMIFHFDAGAIEGTIERRATQARVEKGEKHNSDECPNANKYDQNRPTSDVFLLSLLVWGGRGSELHWRNLLRGGFLVL